MPDGRSPAHFKKLDLNLLVALDALLQERSVTRAGLRLNLSQSAMSGSLARLREYFDDDLLVQVGRQMELTSRALALQDAVRDVLLRIDTSIAELPKFDCTTTDRAFRLLVSDYSLTTLMPEAMQLSQQLRSTAQLHLEQQAPDPARALERGEADILLIPPAFCSPDHPTEIVFEDAYVCVVGKGSRHAKRGLDLDRFVRAEHAVMSPAFGHPATFDRWFSRNHGRALTVAVTAHSFAALPFLVAGTELVATVPGKLARRLTSALPIRILPAPVEIPPIQQAMQWHQYRSADPGLLWLRDLLREAGRRVDTSLGTG